MHVSPRVLAAVAASALIAPLTASPALAAPGEANPPAPRSIADFCAAVPADFRPFTDSGPTFDREIACIAALGITTGGPRGLPEDRYAPELVVNRDAMASFLVRLADAAAALDTGDAVTPLPEAEGPALFTDVVADSVHAESIQRLAQAGIAEGGPGSLGEDSYGPGLPVSRAQMASFVVRTLDVLLGVEDADAAPDYFADDEGAVPHEDNVNRLAEAGIGVGSGANRFQPARAVERGQMAGFVARSLALLEELGAITPLDPVLPVQVLSINDFHGHLDPPAANAPVQTSVAGRLSGVVDQLRGEVLDTSFVSAGDSIGASPFLSAVAQDAPTLEALNAMGLDVSAVGNHEFDRGYADLAGRVRDASDFPYLGANVETAGDLPDLDASAVIETPSGLRLGYIGVVTAETASLVSPGGIEGVTFTDPVAAINREAALLQDGDEANGEADVIIVLAHEGAATPGTTPTECATIGAADDAFGEIVRGSSPSVDAIFGGHTHLRVDCEFPNPGGRSEVRPVLEAAEYGVALAQLTFGVNAFTGEISDVDGRVVTLNEAGFPGVTDPVVEEIVDRAQAAAQELGSPVIGSITADIRRAYLANGTTEDRGSESVLGNFVADVQLEAAQQRDPSVQIAFMNPGGLRADFLREQLYGSEQVGEVTFGEAGVVQPFANTLFTLTMTGAQLDAVLEQQVQPEGASRPFLALGVSEGFFFTYDPSRAAGDRVSGITLDGTEVGPTTAYRVVTNSFLASGGDNFTAFRTATNRVDTGQDDLRALVEYFGRNTPITADTTPRRAILVR